MSKRDYELIASAIRAALASTTDKGETDGICLAIRLIARVLAQDNPKFDSSRFLKACES